MTKLITILLALTSLFIISCSDDDDNTENSVVCDAVSSLCDNEWELIRVEGGLAGINDVVDNGIVEWEVDGTTLEVETSGECTALYCGPEEGDYTISIVTANGKNYIAFDGQEFGEITIDGNTMVINQNSNSAAAISDGFILTFEME